MTKVHKFSPFRVPLKICFWLWQRLNANADFVTSAFEASVLIALKYLRFPLLSTKLARVHARSSVDIKYLTLMWIARIFGNVNNHPRSIFKDSPRPTQTSTLTRVIASPADLRRGKSSGSVCCTDGDAVPFNMWDIHPSLYGRYTSH